MADVHVSEATHWYTRTGAPQYEVPAQKGGMRPATLRDARKIGLVPGVTGVLNMAHKPALVQYIARQHVLAALTLPRREGEAEDDWLRRVGTDAREHGRKAADEGTSLHAALQGHYEGKAPELRWWPHVKGTFDLIRENCGNVEWFCERSFASPMGYGGKCDLSSPAGWVVDFKGKEFDAKGAERLVAFDEHACQLAAYRHGLGMHGARCAIVYVSRNTPGLAKFCEVSAEDLSRGWRMFAALLDFWKAKHRFDPSFAPIKEVA